MTPKEERAKEARDHISRVNGIFEAETAASIERVVIYEDGDMRNPELGEAKFEDTEAVTAWESVAKAIEKAKGRVCVVDPAHFTRPAGGYEKGSWDIESQICAESNLAPILKGIAQRFHQSNKHYGRGGLNSDRAAYIEGVVFTTSGEMKKCDVLAISPVNRKMARENNRSEAECDQDLANRVKTLLNIAAVHEIDTLVLHDFGCGWMGNDGASVAGLFKAWLDEHPGHIGKVVFAIAGGPALDDFRDVFPEEKRVVETEVSGEETENGADDFEIGIEQTSEGRWVFD